MLRYKLLGQEGTYYDNDDDCDEEYEENEEEEEEEEETMKAILSSSPAPPIIIQGLPSKYRSQSASTTTKRRRIIGSIVPVGISSTMPLAGDGLASCEGDDSYDFTQLEPTQSPEKTKQRTFSWKKQSAQQQASTTQETVPLATATAAAVAAARMVASSDSNQISKFMIFRRTIFDSRSPQNTSPTATTTSITTTTAPTTTITTTSSTTNTHCHTTNPSTRFVQQQQEILQGQERNTDEKENDNDSDTNSLNAYAKGKRRAKSVTGVVEPASDFKWQWNTDVAERQKNRKQQLQKLKQLPQESIEQQCTSENKRGKSATLRQNGIMVRLPLKYVLESQKEDAEERMLQSRYQCMQRNLIEESQLNNFVSRNRQISLIECSSQSCSSHYPHSKQSFQQSSQQPPKSQQQQQPRQQQQHSQPSRQYQSAQKNQNQLIQQHQQQQQLQYLQSLQTGINNVNPYSSTVRFVFNSLNLRQSPVPAAAAVPTGSQANNIPESGMKSNSAPRRNSNAIMHQNPNATTIILSDHCPHIRGCNGSGDYKKRVAATTTTTKMPQTQSVISATAEAAAAWNNSLLPSSEFVGFTNPLLAKYIGITKDSVRLNPKSLVLHQNTFQIPINRCSAVKNTPSSLQSIEMLLNRCRKQQQQQSAGGCTDSGGAGVSSNPSTPLARTARDLSSGKTSSRKVQQLPSPNCSNQKRNFAAPLNLLIK